MSLKMRPLGGVRSEEVYQGAQGGREIWFLPRLVVGLEGTMEREVDHWGEESMRRVGCR
jgi:hypothetical protein